VAAGPLVALAACAVPVAAFSLFLLAQFGIVWPTGWANVAGPQYVLPNLQVVVRQNLPHFAAVVGLPVPTVSGPLIAAAATAICLAGLVQLWLRRPALRFVHAALALNLAVIYTSPTYLTPDLFSPATFFRHISVLFPWLLVPIASLLAPGRGSAQTGDLPAPAVQARGGRRRPWRTVGAALGALAALTIAAELTALGASTARDQAQRPTILTADPYVLVSDLARADDGLPWLPFVRDAAGIAAVDPAFNYLAFRTRLFGALRPYDQHFNDAGRAHTLASTIFSLAGLAALCAAQVGREREVRSPPSNSGAITARAPPLPVREGSRG
jgi:hypothetical protein